MAVCYLIGTAKAITNFRMRRTQSQIGNNVKFLSVSPYQINVEKLIMATVLNRSTVGDREIMRQGTKREK